MDSRESRSSDAVSHLSELENHQIASTVSDSLATIKNGSAAFGADCDSQHGDERRENEQKHSSGGDVERSPSKGIDGVPNATPVHLPRAPQPRPTLESIKKLP